MIDEDVIQCADFNCCWCLRLAPKLNTDNTLLNTNSV